MALQLLIYLRASAPGEHRNHLSFCCPCCRVTLSIFPGVLAEDVSSARLGSWYPVVLITVFNFADWAGVMRLGGRSSPLGPLVAPLCFAACWRSWAAVSAATLWVKQQGLVASVIKSG